MTDILKLALESKRIAMDEDTKFRDARSNGPVPGDFGDHLPIPEEAVTIAPISANPRKLKAVSPGDLEMVKLSDIEQRFEIDLGDMDADAAAAFLEKVRIAYQEHLRSK